MKSGRFLKLLIVILVVLAGVVFLNLHRNSYSKDVLRLEILGPDRVNLGEEVEYVVKYRNNGNFRLDNPELVFQPPENSIENNKVVERQVLEKKQLGGAIYPGEEKSVSFKMRLFGKEGEAKIAHAYLTYQPKDLKARYRSDTSLTTVIRSVPITLEFDLPSKVGVGKDFVFRINYFSNLDYPLTDLRIEVEYPSGFEFIQSRPSPLSQTDWPIPILNKSQGGRIEVRGRLEGEVGEAKLFRARLGMWKNGNFIPLKETEKGTEVTKPSLYIRQEINGNPRYVASPGDWLHYTVFFKNIGDDELKDLSLICKLEGDAFDFHTIKSDLGQTTPGDNSVVFDWTRVPKLQYLSPMEEGKVDFWIRVKTNLGSARNPILKDKVFAGQLREEFSTKISSKIEIAQKGYFQDEVFGNSGPIPPRVGRYTTYTIMWEAKNYYSDVKNAEVKAVLPPQSSLTGKIFPEDMASKFSFDPQSREIVWSIGDMARGLGLSGPPLTLAFQISFSPAARQKGRVPEIIGPAMISGEDSWTESEISATSSALTTALPSDPSMTPDKGVVQ